jgi:hypothetical protein
MEFGRALVHILSSSYIQHRFHNKWVILILQFAVHFIKSEPNCNSETCPTSSDSDHEIIGIKEDKDSVVTLPVKKAEHVVSNVLLLCVLLSMSYLH